MVKRPGGCAADVLGRHVEVLLVRGQGQQTKMRHAWSPTPEPIMPRCPPGNWVHPPTITRIPLFHRRDYYVALHRRKAPPNVLYSLSTLLCEMESGPVCDDGDGSLQYVGQPQIALEYDVGSWILNRRPVRGKPMGH